MDLSRIGALVIFLFPLAYSPGPGNAFFASIGAAKGFRAALSPLIGYHVATLFATMAIGLGLEITVLSDPRLMRLLSLVGGLYVIWIGVSFLRIARKEVAGSNRTALGDRGVSFMGGVYVLLFNPKAYVIIGLLFTQFLASGENRFGQVFAIATIFTLNNFVAFVIWTFAGVSITAMLTNDAARRRLNSGFGFCLIGVGVWMLVPALN
jgi:threonine/homoserine/homoserine lactone efflux protein